MGPAAGTGKADATAFWAVAPDVVLASAGSSRRGLEPERAQQMVARQRAARGHRHEAGWVRVLLRQFTNPMVLILVVATVVSMAIGEVTDGAVILAIVLGSGLLGFAQDLRAGREVAALLARVQVDATVLRGGERVVVPVADVVPGDVVVLAAGSVIPADCRLVSANGLLVDESVLTGESFPAEKDADAPAPAAAGLADRPTAVFFGTHVASGTGLAVACAVGEDTELGRLGAALRAPDPVTAYERGITRFGYLLVRLMLVLTAFIFVVNTAFGRPLLESLLFSIALAVGLTPQMLPAILTLSLSAGARRMAREQVVVKRLDVIEDFGSMAVLCTDKTGTLTEGAPQLDHALDLAGHEDETVLDLAAHNAGLQSGFANPMDAAILARRRPPAGTIALAEVPYDFTRKRLSVLTVVDGTPVLIVKGAFAGVLALCTGALVAGGEVPIGDAAADVTRRFEELSADGYRVLALATRPLPDAAGAVGPDDERDLTLRGLLAFHDPVKPTAAAAVRTLADLGVSLRLITGDHELAARAAAERVGLPTDRVLTGPALSALDDDALAAAVGSVRVFAEIEPHAKRRLVLAFRRAGVGVGFLGDGINDAPALHAADVGISVDTAVDVAREAAAVVLLQKDLSVVIDGVRLGRTTFANTRKYVRLTTSANVGNMVSMAVASLVLPFLPLLPLQILLLNFLSDIPALGIAGDRVDPEQTERAASWDLAETRRYLLVFGAVSTVFDLVTFAVLLVVLRADAEQFRSAWFIESTVTELLVLFSLRTARPMLRSRPSRLLLGLSLAVVAVVVATPFVPVVAGPLGLEPPTSAVLVAIAGIAAAYVIVNEAVKRRYVRRTAAGGPAAPEYPAAGSR